MIDYSRILYKRYDLVLCSFGIKDAYTVLGCIVNEIVVYNGKSLVMMEIVFQDHKSFRCLEDPFPYGTDYISKYTNRYCIVHVCTIEKFLT